MDTFAAILIIVNLSGGQAQLIGFKDMPACEDAEKTIAARFNKFSSIRAQCIYGPAFISESK